MADVVDRRTRSRMMSGIKGRDTKPERVVRSYLHRAGLRFRLHRTGLPGRPDLVFPKFRVAVFVHGCFWHRHESCRFATTPASNVAFWQAKFAQNVDRDSRVQRELRRAGWRVVTVWECDLGETALRRLVKKIQGKARLPK